MTDERDELAVNITHFTEWIESLHPGDPMRGPMRHAANALMTLKARIEVLEGDNGE